MSMLFHFNKPYFIIASIIFFTEIMIELYAHDNFIRPYAGDFLVVILIYCFLRSFFITPVLRLAIGVLLFSYVVETLQYYKLVNMLGLQHSKLARILIGTSFEWIDIISYTAGIALVILLERILANNRLTGKHKS